MLVWSTALCVAAAALLLLLHGRKATTSGRRLPPGPRGWPVVGNIFDLGSRPHATLAGLKRKYGPLIWLQLGSVDTLVISSSKAAMEMFKNHDQSFSNRHLSETLKSDDTFSATITLSNYGPYWRMLRRLCTTELFSRKRIKDTRLLRRRCVDKMIKWISDEAEQLASTSTTNRSSSNGIEVSPFVMATVFNMISNLVLSRDLIVDPKSTKGNDFFELINEIQKLVGTPNVADFFPASLRWLDPQGLKKKIKQKFNLVLEILDSFVEERRLRHGVDDVQHQQDDNKMKDFLDVLLQFEGNGKDEPTKISGRNLNMVILELFLAGIETTTTTVEWALTELLRNPKSMKMVRAEIAQIVGHERKIEESDIEDLHYLNAVIKETLRLHPTTPFLVPHSVVKDVEFMGYWITKDTQVFINVWGIGRDPSIWDDPLSFKPERFLGSNVDYRGQNFEFLPFGAGRRMCPGIPLGHQMLHLVLGSLLQSFEWTQENGVTPETIDMGENLGTTLRKAIPLKAIPRALLVV
ncbi:Cytochrome P450 [Macleaya cordata]|uniref:Cytochrome P450 n=1 Tax=Macleaya cordata TaxID=56857 RepID=A0A200PYJ0_MACCD|nr:Cytochrome P450 [Macleaya cordata]